MVGCPVECSVPGLHQPGVWVGAVRVVEAMQDGQRIRGLRADPRFTALVGMSHKKWEFTSYLFKPGIASPTLVLEAGVNF